jgi:hypothetical protein
VIIVQVNEAFEELEDGNDDALKTVLERQKAQLRWVARMPGLVSVCHADSFCTSLSASPCCHVSSDLIELINGPLSKKNDRKRLITLCTVDVHARDVVQRLIDERVESGQVRGRRPAPGRSLGDGRLNRCCSGLEQGMYRLQLFHRLTPPLALWLLAPTCSASSGSRSCATASQTRPRNAW